MELSYETTSGVSSAAFTNVRRSAVSEEGFLRSNKLQKRPTMYPLHHSLTLECSLIFPVPAIRHRAQGIVEAEYVEQWVTGHPPLRLRQGSRFPSLSARVQHRPFIPSCFITPSAARNNLLNQRIDGTKLGTNERRRASLRLSEELKSETRSGPSCMLDPPLVTRLQVRGLRDEVSLLLPAPTEPRSRHIPGTIFFNDSQIDAASENESFTPLPHYLYFSG